MNNIEAYLLGIEAGNNPLLNEQSAVEYYNVIGTEFEQPFLNGFALAREEEVNA